MFIDGGSSTGDGVYGVEGEEEGEIAAAQEGGETLHVYDVDEHGVDVNDQVWEAVEEEEKSTRDVLMAFFFSSPSSTNPLDASLALGRPRRLRFFKKEYSHGVLRFLRADDDQFDVLLGGWQEGEERRGVVISSTRGGGEDTRGGGVDGKGGEEKGRGRGGGSFFEFEPVFSSAASRVPRWFSSQKKMGDSENSGDDDNGGGGGGSRRNKRGKELVGPGFNVTVNVTVYQLDISEDTKRAAAISVTLMRGLMPMHAVWAGLTATRYVRQLWLELSRLSLGTYQGRGAGVDVLGCIMWSWFYHGTFDFSIMAIPALMMITGDGGSGVMVLALTCTGIVMVITSWLHLSRATFGLEKDLTAIGLVPPGGGAGLPRLGTCTGPDRRRCCCCCLPCAACLCADVAEWDKDDPGVEVEGGGSGGVPPSYGSIK